MSTTAEIAERTLILTRTLNAPRELVFQVWTDPRHLVRWWGPHDFTLPHCEQDLRVGGHYRFCMRAPDGSDHWVRGEYLVIDRPERLEFSWLREDEHGDIWCENTVRITLEADGPRTKLVLHQAVFATAQHCIEHGEGWNESLDRLKDYVDNTNTAGLTPEGTGSSSPTTPRPTTMATKIFVNLCISDLKRSRTFFTQLGYRFNEQFSNETTGCLVISDDIFAMLLQPEDFKRFTSKAIVDATKSTEVLIALSFDSKEAAMALYDKAITGGATESRPAEDHGFMYTRSFNDLDGHIWEVFWMDPKAVQG